MPKETENIIAQAAEAIIIREGNNIIKRRIKKSYRIPEIDESLRKKRTKKESKLIESASKIIPVPKIIKTDESSKEIVMQFIEGKKLSDWLGRLGIEKAKNICQSIGESIAKLHDAEIIHGDLTTSNMILNEKDNKVYFIDFGLGFNSERIEDKAVDLHLLRQALEAKHFQHWKILFDSVVKGYKKSKKGDKTLLQLQKVEARGRYKH
ncbi:Kae1-associated serine/threonine protein kinase [Candidatus Pacearchaeota archaeon]|nr:Kae1-associated serine/threonine protein kinase [Candidatus Pacearchaeota archaeon]